MENIVRTTQEVLVKKPLLKRVRIQYSVCPKPF